MLTFILRRFVAMALVLWAVVTLTFLIVYVAPGDPFVRELIENFGAHVRQSTIKPVQ